MTRPQIRTGAALTALALITTVAPLTTHLVSLGDRADEAAEHAETLSLAVVLGPLVALGLLAFLWRTARRGSQVWSFALAPITAFGAQEIIERLTTAPTPEPGFVGTFVVQLVLSTLAFALARLLIHTVRRLLRCLVLSHRPRPGPCRYGPRIGVADAVWPASASGTHRGRAPPALT